SPTSPRPQRWATSSSSWPWSSASCTCISSGGRHGHECSSYLVADGTGAALHRAHALSRVLDVQRLADPDQQSARGPTALVSEGPHLRRVHDRLPTTIAEPGHQLDHRPGVRAPEDRKSVV